MMSIEKCVEVLNKELKNVSHYNAMSPCMHRTHQEDMADAYTLTIQILSRLNEKSIVEILKYKDYPDKNYTLKDFKKVCPSQYREYVKQAQSLIQALTKEVASG